MYLYIHIFLLRIYAVYIHLLKRTPIFAEIDLYIHYIIYITYTKGEYINVKIYIWYRYIHIYGAKEEQNFKDRKIRFPLKNWKKKAEGKLQVALILMSSK